MPGKPPTECREIRVPHQLGNQLHGIIGVLYQRPCLVHALLRYMLHHGESQRLNTVIQTQAQTLLGHHGLFNAGVDLMLQLRLDKVQVTTNTKRTK